MSFNFRSEATKYMRVCRSWKDVAKDIVWKELENLIPLLVLLAPLETHPTAENYLVCYPELYYSKVQTSNFV